MNWLNEFHEWLDSIFTPYNQKYNRNHKVSPIYLDGTLPST